MRVLVVDDSNTMLRIISNTLKRLKITDIITANDGIDAWEIIQSSSRVGINFDIILTDWNMPNMNGLELTKNIRSVDRDIPIVMVTTEGGKLQVIEALKAGVNNYIVKPFTPQTLKEKLEMIIGI